MEHRLRIAAFALGALSFTAAALAHDPVPPPRTVAVGGEGEVSVKPDRARLVMAVTQLGGQQAPMKARVMQAEAFDSGNQEMGVVPGEIRYRAAVSAEFDLLAP